MNIQYIEFQMHRVSINIDTLGLSMSLFSLPLNVEHVKDFLLPDMLIPKKGKKLFIKLELGG